MSLVSIEKVIGPHNPVPIDNLFEFIVLLNVAGIHFVAFRKLEEKHKDRIRKFVDKSNSKALASIQLKQLMQDVEYFSTKEIDTLPPRILRLLTISKYELIAGKKLEIDRRVRRLIDKIKEYMSSLGEVSIKSDSIFKLLIEIFRELLSLKPGPDMSFF